MFDLGFNLLDPPQVKVAALSNGAGGVLRDNARVSQRKAGSGFHLQPAAKLVFFTPDSAHFRAGITRYQRRLLAQGGGKQTMINAAALLAPTRAAADGATRVSGSD